jgi:prevent-host-death family protein
MDVAITVLRAHLSEWIDHARNGEEVIVTERGMPIVRLIGIDTTTKLEQLVAAGVISNPERSDRPLSTNRTRVRARGSVSDLVSEQRD